MSKVRKGSPLLILVLLAVAVFAVGAAIRFALIKPVGVTVTIIDNEYVIEIYTEAGEVGPVESITFTGDLIRDDPSQPTCTVSTVPMYLARTGTTTGDFYVTWSVSGLPDGASMTWIYGQDTDWVEGTPGLSFDSSTERMITGYISGIDKTHIDETGGISGIDITFEVHDQVT